MDRDRNSTPDSNVSGKRLGLTFLALLLWSLGSPMWALGQVDLKVRPAPDFGADDVWLDQGAPAPHHLRISRPCCADRFSGPRASTAFVTSAWLRAGTVSTTRTAWT